MPRTCIARTSVSVWWERNDDDFFAANGLSWLNRFVMIDQGFESGLIFGARPAGNLFGTRLANFEALILCQCERRRVLVL